MSRTGLAVAALCVGGVLTAGVLSPASAGAKNEEKEVFALTFKGSGSPGDASVSGPDFRCHGATSTWGKPGCLHEYARGTTITIRALALRGDRFTGWGGACHGSSTTCTLKMTQKR